jgi:antitoxin component YwqK of YwqJK toxin-antitoxin module
MKRIVTYFILTILCCSSIYGQKLTLTDLTTLCGKKNWEDVNQTLLAKKWTYYDSEKGNTYKYNTITWSFNKDYYSEKAQAWFYLYTYEGYPNKISYSVFNKESYSIIQNSIASAGFKLINSEIENNEIISTYSNANYTLKVSTEKRDKSDYSWESKSLTAYNFTLIKKAGIYDPDNGKKTDYYYGDVVKAEYTLLNGKINGQVKTYHYNGKIKLIGNYTNGEKNGLFKEYDDSGNLETEYSMSNGELNGVLKTYYSNGKLRRSGNYLKGEEHGSFVEYDEYGTKEAEYVMANGMKNGVLKVYEDGKIDVSTTFKDDIKNGQRIEYYYND